MKKRLWIPALVAVIFIGDRIGGFFLEKMVAESQFRYSRLYHSTDNADVILLGNSRGLTFYQPEIERLTGLSTLNLSYNGLPMDLGKTLVEDYLDHHAAPKTLVIDVTMCERKNAALVTSFKTYAAASPRLAELLRGTDATAFWSSQLLHLYRYNSEVFQRAAFYRSKSDKDWLLDRTITAAMVNDATLGGFKKGLEGDEVRHVAELVAYAQARGVAVQLVISPYFPRFAEHIEQPFLHPLTDAVEKATGLTVHNYATLLADATDFGDYQHPNKRGSLKYIQKLDTDGVFGEQTAIGSLPQNFRQQSFETMLLPSANAAPSVVFVSNPSTPSVSSPKKTTSARWRHVAHWFAADTLFSMK